jgi:hypothetical protein
MNGRGDTFGRQQGQHDADVEERLHHDHRSHAQGKVPAKRVSRAQWRSQSAPGKDGKQCGDQYRPITSGSSEITAKMKSVCGSGR